MNFFKTSWVLGVFSIMRIMMSAGILMSGQVIFSPVYASEIFHYPLIWEGSPGAVYEIEILEHDKKILLKKQLKENSFNFPILKPGMFYWRLRTHNGREWLPFSELYAINASDKVNRLNKPLMISPLDSAKIIFTKNKITKINFKWREPFKDLDYYLEFYRHKEAKPFKRIKVKGGIKSLRFKTLPQPLYWRVSAISKFKNENANQEKFSLVLMKPQIQRKHRIELGARYYYSQSSFKHDLDNSLASNLKKTIPITGSVFLGIAEFSPAQWYNERSFVFSVRQANLTSTDSSLIENKFGLEYGMLLQKTILSHHRLYLGTFLDTVNVKIMDGVNAYYYLYFISTRYQYQRQLTSKLISEIELGLHLPALEFTPSYLIRSALNYNITERMQLGVYALYEQFISSGDVSEESYSGKINITLNNLGLGIGLNYSI